MIGGLLALEVVARINRVDFDARAVVREFGLQDELAPEELIRIAKVFGFRARRKSLSLEKLASGYPLPAIAILNSGGYRVLLKVDPVAGRALLLTPGEKNTTEMDADSLQAEMDSCLVLSHRKSSSHSGFGFRWFLQEIGKFRRIIAEVLLGSFVVQLFGLVTPLFTQVILDKVLVHHSLSTLDVLAVAFLAVVLFELLLNIARNYIFIHTTSKLDAKLGAKLFRHLLGLPFRYFESRQVGNIAARVRELDTIREFITNKAVSVLIDVFFSGVFVVVMLLYSVKLTLVALGFVTVIALLYLTVTPELRRRLKQKFQMGAASNSYLVESVTGMQTVKSLAIEGAMQRRWEDHLGQYVRSSFRLANMSKISGAVAGSLQRLMTISILYLGVRAVLQGEMTIGQLIAFQMFAGQFTGPVLRLTNRWNEFQQALLSVDRLGDILNQPLETPSDKAITLPSLRGQIRFENVSFQYTPNGSRVLDGVDLTIEPGQCVGIVGRSGSGKSTLAKLLQRLYIPNEGAIFIDGIDVRHMNPFWLRHNIGVVLQENYLFSGTIRDNIALPRPDAPMELVLEAARLAGAHEFVSAMPEGYDTRVSERGGSLSGGQKQRIAIARALITRPRLLIFDEATSALDYESERIIRDNMRAIRQGRTTLIIAHRLSTIRDCDRILVMEQGKVVESGTHEQLLNQGDYYHHLHSQQA
ncbi:type I secretion system permease/ATPase [Geothermobacter hydrogeniphilus]|uniref:Type I secretion system permease/ATPase n=1 Tax=Geothermobacter hydrogeniphilus TaxID=1969733 RepID=A0A2K2H6Z0_9BACT|nr:type I secretion system permease/ATPase [Geothermobacter hydrogeniphilus]PNU19085.1 type I secretion system permease/ATPase [Geothermobacter hydrogeniphilus]